MSFPNFDIYLPQYNQHDPIINEEMIVRYERKVKKQKNLRLLEFSLAQFQFKMPAFDSLTSYQRLVQLMQAGKNLFLDNTTYQKTIDLFRNRIGLPNVAFDAELHFRDKMKEKEYLCSREIIESFFPLLLKNKKIDTNPLVVDLPLSSEALEVFEIYVYTNRVQACSTSAFKELYLFAKNLNDKKFQADLFNLFIECFDKDKNEDSLDLECLEFFANDFIEFYFQKEIIHYSILTNNKFLININDFNFFFGKTSKLNNFIIKYISALEISTVPNLLMSCFINRDYLKNISQILFEYQVSLYTLNELSQVFINFYLPHSFLAKTLLFTCSSLKTLPDSSDKNKIEEYLLTVIKAEPTFDFVYAWLYEIYVEDKLFEKAEKYIREAIALNPHKYCYILHLVCLLKDQKKFTEAEMYLKNFAQIYPTKKVYKELASLSLITNIDEAKIYYEKVLQFDPNNSSAHEYLGLINLQQNNWDQAEMHLRQSNENHTYELACCHLADKLKEFSEFKFDFKIICEQAPKFNFGTFSDSITTKLKFTYTIKFIEELRFVQAYKKLLEIQKLFPFQSNISEFVGDLCALLGKSDQAIMHYNKVLLIDSDNQKVRKKINNLLLKLKKNETKRRSSNDF